VIEGNSALQNKPETINSDPHAAGWLVKIKLTNPAEINDLMDAKAYEAYIAEKQKEASA
jgi:glycine cleavage system H protein